MNKKKYIYIYLDVNNRGKCLKNTIRKYGTKNFRRRQTVSRLFAPTHSIVPWPGEMSSGINPPGDSRGQGGYLQSYSLY